jgi:hypothetical protein
VSSDADGVENNAENAAVVQRLTSTTVGVVDVGSVLTVSPGTAPKPLCEIDF